MIKGGVQHVSSGTLKNSFDRRTVVIGAIQGGLGVLLAARVAWIGVAQNEKYKLESESNRVNLALSPPRRGWILDRYGAPLASLLADCQLFFFLCVEHFRCHRCLNRKRRADLLQFTKQSSVY